MRIPSLLLATAHGMALVASIAVAADRRIEGTVKAVDAERLAVTLTTTAGAATKDQRLDVLRKAKVTVDGRDAALGDVRRGQRAIAVFNDELEVVTRLDATGEGVAPMVPEVAVLNELPEPDLHRTGPWPTADGLTLYWKTQPVAGGGQAWIWSARRTSKDALFQDAKRLLPGSDMTVAADGLEMILLQGANLWSTSRPSIDAAFARPRQLAEFDGQGFISVPCLVGDDLTLYADRFFKGQPVAPVRSTRASRRAQWGSPTAVEVPLPAGKRARFFTVTPDGSRAFCVLFEVTPDQPGGPARLNRSELATMRAEGNGFGRPVVIRLNGEPLRGIFPRYVPATNELFYVRQEEDRPAEIVVVRNFDPEAIEAAPQPAATAPARPDREAIQGRWAAASEQVGGALLSPEQIRQMNKRLEVRGERFVIRRVGLGGKFGVYDGTFRLDPKADPKTFDWTGKGPAGATELRGIYELEGDTLRLCYVEAASGAARPTELRSTEGSQRILIVLDRERK